MKQKMLVIFGSPSNKPSYDPICKALDNAGIEYALRICSCHRTPDLLDTILREKYTLIIAGAGLAAHLPGVIASKVLTPVIGVPVPDAFGGLDAFLSIVQLPPGLPVMAVGENPARTIQKAGKSIQSGFRGGG